MKLTPLDIHHKEFRHSLRGYAEEEVDAFLDEVADEFERLFKENIDLSEKLEAAKERVRSFEEQEQTIRNTMVAAQRSADDIASKAREESSAVLRDAELKSKEIIHNALQQKQKVAGELVRIKQAEEEFRGRFKALLDQHASTLSEVRLPEDVTVLMGDTDEGVVSAVEVAPPVFAQPVSAPTPASFVAPAQPVAEPDAALDFDALSDSDAVAEPDLTVEPPASGFVESVQLGEIGGSDLSAEEPEFSDPKEFQLRPFDQMGERDDDIEIEEID